MKPSDNIKKIFKQTKINTNSDMDKLVREDAVKAMSESKNKATVSYWPDVRKIIMNSKTTRFAIAAVLIIAASIGLIHWQQNKEIQIPPELAKMPAEKLFAIHNDLAKSPFDSIMIEAALKNSLDKISVRDVLALAAKLKEWASVLRGLD